MKSTLTIAGDAAHYLDTIPENIVIRHEIRRDGIELLRKLHMVGRDPSDDNTEFIDKPYDRVVVIGHSLGSAIAYDVLKT
jgi:alpha-beta hydrolase superfamily lysophospholipase